MRRIKLNIKEIGRYTYQFGQREERIFMILDRMTEEELKEAYSTYLQLESMILKIEDQRQVTFHKSLTMRRKCAWLQLECRKGVMIVRYNGLNWNIITKKNGIIKEEIESSKLFIINHFNLLLL